MSTPTHNAILRGGPRDGILMQLEDHTQRIVEYLEDGGYNRTTETEDGRTIFQWVSDSGHPQVPNDPAPEKLRAVK